jgi:type II secretory pathway component GspD/PulD (secretin)
MTATRLIVVALTGLLASLPASPVLAQKATLDSRLEVRFEATPAADVFRSIVSGLGLELQLEPKVQGPVTIWVKDVSARTALNVVCESLGCQWRVNGTRLVVSQAATVTATSGRGLAWVVTPARSKAEQGEVVKKDFLLNLKKPLPVDMQFNDVPVSTVLRAMSEVSGIEITTDEPLASKHITLTGSGRTVEDALKAVIEQAGGFNVSAVFRMQATGDKAPSLQIAIRPMDIKK